MSSAQPEINPHRFAAWCALSELFLEPASDDADIAVIARQLSATGIALPELERIYEDEVAPVCWRNLRAPAGAAWSAFDRSWLVTEIERRRSLSMLDRVPFLHRLRIRRWTRDSREDWLRVQRLLAD